MKEITKQRRRLALLNAAEFIRGHVETGLEPEDVNEETEQGLSEYSKACEFVAKKLEKEAEKY